RVSGGLVDDDRATGRRHVEQCQHIGIAQPDAAVGQGHAHGLVVAGAMQVDVATLGVIVSATVDAGLLTAEPEDPGQDPVTLGMGSGELRRPDFPGRAAADEYGAQGLPGTDARAHPVAPTGSTAAAIALTGTILRRRDMETTTHPAGRKAGQQLLFDGYVDQAQLHGHSRGSRSTR